MLSYILSLPHVLAALLRKLLDKSWTWRLYQDWNASRQSSVLLYRLNYA
jgi:hypothetical protein